MRHFIIPDTQVKPDSNIDHLTWAGKYAVSLKPDVIVHLGDHWDFPSLSSYDKGKKSFEGRRYQADVLAGKQAMEAFHTLTRTEGIIPALESAHAVYYATKLAEGLSKEILIVINLSGRGDKDLDIIFESMEAGI